MSRAYRARLALFTLATLGVAISCDENLPSGPNTFTAAVAIVVSRDTIVVGDSLTAQAKTTDGEGRLIQGLRYDWTSADTNILGFASVNTADSSSMSGRSRTYVGKRPGRAAVTMTLPDARFQFGVPATRNATVVLGGVRVLSSHDTTLSAISDTGRAIATGLVRVNGAFVERASQGIKWTHLGDRATVVGSGDTIRYVARTNGVDTLIATHDFCLAGAKCADTVFVRVSQTLALGLTTRSFQSWTFFDSLAPTIVLSDRRGNGQPGTIIRFVPRTSFDSNLVRVVPGPFGTTNPTTGQMATPKVQTAGNGFAIVLVQGISSTGLVLATDSFTVTTRQVALRVASEPQRAVMSSVDILPIKGIARDARGAPITDATILLTPTGIPYDGIYIGPAQPVAAQATVVPTLSGSSLPGANPLAPQIPVTTDASVITILAPDSVKAGVTQINVSTQVLDSLGQLAIGKWVRFRSVPGTVVDSAQVDVSGTVGVSWIPPNVAGTYSLTGVRSAPQLSTVGDSAGRIVIRRSILVYADTATTAQSTLSVNATTVVQSATLTVTVTLRDQFGNPAKSTPPNFVLSAGGVGGTFSAPTCSQGVCTATYTAPGTAGAASISAKIGIAEISFSPIAITVTP